MTRKLTLFATAAVLALISIPVHAVTIFSQTPPSNVNGTFSDVALTNDRTADDFTLGAAATVRSVTWRGFYHSANTPAFPLSFDLTIYDDNASLPGNVLSTTSVMFNALGDITDTGIQVVGIGIPKTVFEFQANLTLPLALAAGTYWFSPLADTTNDADDGWFWTGGPPNGHKARQTDVAGNGPWAAATPSVSHYFVLDDEAISIVTGNAVPEPISAMLGLMGLGVLGVTTRRRV